MKKKKQILLPILIFLGVSFHGVAQEIKPSWKVTSWNLEWLTTTPMPSIKVSQRTAQDFNALANHFAKMMPQVIAFQEVDSIEAIRKVVGKDYKIFISDRAKQKYKNQQFKNINQYTGFAIANSISYQAPNDIDLLQRSEKLRFASYVIVNDKNGRPLHLLSVHLKAGCSGKFKEMKDCQTLKQQSNRLNQWMRNRIEQQQSFIILGDFNHNLSFHNDWLWRDLSKNISNQIYLATKETKADCIVRQTTTNSHKKHFWEGNSSNTYQFKNIIDHIIVSQDLKNHVAKQEVFDKNEVLKYRLSDHCPVSVLI